MNRAKQLFDQLVALDAAISEEYVVEYILRGLGSEYRSFTCNIEARLTLKEITKDCNRHLHLLLLLISNIYKQIQ
jgi:hypothetical protein